CRKRYDVALMNPPFGDSAKGAKQSLAKNFPATKQDVYGAFIEESLIRLADFGRLGAITSRTGFFLSTFQKWREDIFLERAWPTVFADLGNGVLDGAMVETAAFCLERTTRNTLTSMKQSFPSKRTAPFFSLLKATDKSATLLDCIASITQGHTGNSEAN